MEILVVDDHQLIRTGLREMLPLRFPNSRIYEADTGETALELAQAQHCDLAVADLFMPGETAFSFLRQLCDACPELPVVVLSASENAAHVRKCIDYGASAFVPKAAPQDELIGAIETALAGGVFFPSLSEQAYAADDAPALDLDAVTDALTERQLEILALVAQGKSNKQIARECNCSDNTVKVHVSAILRALDLNNRTQAGILGQRLGLASSPASL